MSTPEGTESAHVTAWRAALAGVAGGAPVLQVDEVPKDPPSEYIEFDVVRALNDSGRMSGGPPPVVGWRLTYRVVAMTLDSARVLRSRVAQLEGTRIPAIGSTDLKFEGDEPIGDDDGRQSGFGTRTYSAPRYIPA